MTWMMRTQRRLLDAMRRSAKSAASTVTALVGAAAVLITTGEWDGPAAVALLAGLGAAVVVDLGVAVRESLLDFADDGGDGDASSS